uniref:Uncharacterized protein n=1 Tax=Cacopsylla melanoneura TaxID=428564 RepID=A0A8D8PPZ9_9HEMI
MRATGCGCRAALSSSCWTVRTVCVRSTLDDGWIRMGFISNAMSRNSVRSRTNISTSRGKLHSGSKRKPTVSSVKIIRNELSTMFRRHWRTNRKCWKSGTVYLRKRPIVVPLTLKRSISL